MIRGVHTMFYTSQPEALHAFLRDKLGFPATDGGGAVQRGGDVQAPGHRPVRLPAGGAAGALRGRGQAV